MNHLSRIVIVLCILAVAAGTGTAAFMRGQVTQSSFPAPPQMNCVAPAGTPSLCQTCLRAFCTTMGPAKAFALCGNYCTVGATPSSASSAFSSARSTSPVCGNMICEPTEAQYCPRDCPGASSASRSSASSFDNPLGLTCTPLPIGTDGCSACLSNLCTRFPEEQAISYCQATCMSIRSASSSSSARSSVTSQSSSNGEPGGAFTEITTSNAQMFKANGEGWVPYGISRIHKNTIAANDAQATATWQVELPFADHYALYMFLPHSKEAAQQQLMDKVPMNVNLNALNYSFTVNQRNAPIAFSETIGGAGPETVQHNWYYLGTFKPVTQAGLEQPQTLRLFLSTGRASDSTKKAADGWVAAGDLRIYYPLPTIRCGDGKCHESERFTCSIDCPYNGTTGGTGGMSSVSQSSAYSRSSSFNGLYCGDGKCSEESGENAENCSKDCDQDHDVLVVPSPIIDEPPASPTCDNRSGASRGCSLCLSSFCGFSETRANWLCSLYCSPPKLSAVIETQELSDESHKDEGVWSWLSHVTASLFKYVGVDTETDPPNADQVPM